jgi:hypothetical protein
LTKIKKKWNTDTINETIERYQRGEEVDLSCFFENDIRYKNSNIIFQMKKEELEEWKKCSEDVVYFANNYCYVMTDEGYNKIKLRPYQEKILKDFQNEKFNILLASRQIGKTISSSIFICWYMIFNYDKNVFVVANKYDTTIEIVSKIKSIIEKLPFFLKPGIIAKKEKRLVFDNGCQLHSQATTKNTGIGFTIHLLYVDEFAHIHHNFIVPFYRSVYPTLSSSKVSKMIISSTANGMNLFYELWQGAINGENSFNPIKVEWYEVPGRDEEWKNKEIKNLGSEELFEQEYGNKFILTSQTLIKPSVIKKYERYISGLNYRVVEEFFSDKIKTETLKYLKWLDGFDPLKKFKENERFVISIDLAGGLERDYSVINIFKIELDSLARIKTKRKNFKNEIDFIGLKQVGIFRSNITEFNEIVSVLKILLCDIFTYNDECLASVIIEYNFNGDFLYYRLMEDEKLSDNIFLKTKHTNDSSNKKLGVKINSFNKPLYVNLLKDLIETEKIIITNKETLYELKHFGKDKNGSFRGIGVNDDTVSTLLLLAPYLSSEMFQGDADLFYSGSDSKIQDIIYKIMEKKETKDDFDIKDFLPKIY